MKRVSGSGFSLVPGAVNLCLVDVVPNYASDFVPNSTYDFISYASDFVPNSMSDIISHASDFVPNSTSNFISYASDFVPNFAPNFLVNSATDLVFNPANNFALDSVYESSVSKYSPLICPDSYPVEGGACCRFVIDRRREVREERGCGREKYGSYFVESGSWKEGIPFMN